MIDAWLLYRSTFGNNGFRLVFWTKECGVVSCLYRQSTSKTSLLGILQPFVPLLIELKVKATGAYIYHVESRGLPYCFSSHALYCALYINELLYRLLPYGEPEPILYDAYDIALHSLLEAYFPLEMILRRFERCLLETTGTLPEYDGILPEKYYIYVKEIGFIASNSGFLGKDILAVMRENYDSVSVLKTAKLLMRQFISMLPGAKNLTSPRLFRNYFLSS